MSSENTLKMLFIFNDIIPEWKGFYTKNSQVAVY